MAEKEKILFGEPCYKIRTLEEKNKPAFGTEMPKHGSRTTMLT